MTIDRSGTWWTGQDLNDLADYLRELCAEGYEIDDVRESVCSECTGRVFGLRADRTEGGARRTCRACGRKQFIADSEEYWKDARPRTWKCVCGGKDANIAVGYSRYPDGEDIRWITVGQR